MPPVMDHPSELAREIARLLDSDPIAASQVKEHLKPDRITELLNMPLREFEDAGLDEVMEEFPNSEILRWVRRNFSRSDVLKAFGG